MADRNICNVDILETMTEDTNVIVEENGALNKFNIYNEFNTVNTKINNEIDAVNTKVLQLSNPNLFMNSDFRNPINQRDATSYTLDASARTYTIDRWCSANAIKVVLEDDGIHIYNTGSQTYVYLLQYIETPLIVGEKYTISAKINGVICSHTFIAGEGFNTDVPYFTYDPVSDSLAYDRIGFRIEDSYLVEYAKLEPGSIATPFVPRPRAEELMLCKRYYQKYLRFLGLIELTSATQAFLSINTRGMRTTPSLGAGNKTVNVNIANTNLTGKINNINSNSDENMVLVMITMDTSNSGLVGHTGVAYCDGTEDSYLSLNAEIY